MGMSEGADDLWMVDCGGARIGRQGISDGNLGGAGCD